MIVKNEKDVIVRCLTSVKPYIDYWVIVDTGSNDGTQEIIKEFMKDVPGELHEQKWVNFGHNRNEALVLAKGKGDYVLFIDADEVLEGAIDKKILKEEAYVVTVYTCKDPMTSFQRALMIQNSINWKWKGVIHEKLEAGRDIAFKHYPELLISAVSTDGNRSKEGDKYLKDAEVLEKALLTEPDNSDYVYYLAQCYFNAKKFPESLKNYQKRAKMEGWDQFTFWAKYYSGYIQELLEMGQDEILESYSDAFLFRPIRAEPLCRMANYFHAKKNYILGFIISKFALTISRPDDLVYVEDWVYDYGTLAVYANCAMEMGFNDEAKEAYKKIANNTKVPDFARSQARATIEFLRNKK